jgi:PAS domain S-box-containing protein
MLRLPGPEVFAAVVDRIETGVYVLDGTRRIVYWNHGAEKITGLRTQEMLGRPCVRNLGLEEIEHNPAVYGHANPLERNDGEPRRDATVSMRHRSGRMLRVRLWTMAIQNAAGEIVGAAKVFSEWVNATEGSAEKKAGLGEEAHGESRLPGRAAAEVFLQNQIDFGTHPGGEVRPDPGPTGGAERIPAWHGQEAAAAIVREVSRTLRDMMRTGDFLGSWGPGSFLAVLPGCGLGPLRRLSERMKEAAGRVAISWWGDRLSLKVSARAAFLEAGDTVARVESRLKGAGRFVGQRATTGAAQECHKQCSPSSESWWCSGPWWAAT